MLNNTIFISKETSKLVLNNIILGKKINYEKLNLKKQKSKIEKIKKEYNNYKLNSDINNYNLKFHFFWKKVSNYYKLGKIEFKGREQSGKDKFTNILFYEFGQLLGFNPSLLTLLVYHKEIKSIYKFQNFFKKLKLLNEIENLDFNDRKIILEILRKKKINIITPLCPDYEHVKISHNLYKYTFNKLNTGVGLIAKRLIKIIDKFHKIFRSEKIKFNHYLFYGDFEAYSKENCERLKITEKQFIKNLNLSVKNLEKETKNIKVGLLVKTLSNKKKWLKICEKNYKKLLKKYNSDKYFKLEINDIASSRSLLYSNWYTKVDPKDYYKIVLNQGAEYTSMGDIFENKFENFLIFGLDHYKMKKFYSINKSLAVIYGKPNYE
jgi:hypothetical protein|tara:strand:+ start:712 stop:1848 length:1137 start_codon:yes stop_codon:yes gene_type:complete